MGTGSESNIVLFLDIREDGNARYYHEAADALGLEPIVLTEHSYRDEVLSPSKRVIVPKLNVREVVRVVHEIGRGRVSGIFGMRDTTCVLAARAAAELNLPHGDPQAMARCNNKLECRDFLAKRGMRSIEYVPVASPSEARDAADRLGGKVVVKQLISGGSRGVRICETSSEAADWAARLLGKSKVNRLLVERYIDGPQYSIEIFDGRGIQIERVYVAKGVVPLLIGFDAPPMISAARLSELIEYAERVASLIGHTRGPGMVEVKMTGDDIYLVEINPRSGVFSPLSFRSAYGIDLPALCLKFACGMPYSIEDETAPRRAGGYSMRFVIRDGLSVRGIDGVDETRRMDNVERVVVMESNFGRLGPASSFRDRIAYVCSKAHTPELAAASADAALARLTVVPENPARTLLKKLIRRFRR